MAEQQSPVDIPSGAPSHDDGLVLEYQPVPLAFAENEYVLQVDCPAGSHATLEGHRFELVQFHFHCPAEHSLDGRREPAELHFVHLSPTHGLGVLGVLLAEGSAHAGLQPLISALEDAGGGAMIDPVTLVPAERSHVRYHGSLTMPPYTEGVAWYVLTTPVTISAPQLRTLQAAQRDNARPVQPLNKRAFR